jgi:hypothetical protein
VVFSSHSDTFPQIASSPTSKSSPAAGSSAGDGSSSAEEEKTPQPLPKKHGFRPRNMKVGTPTIKANPSKHGVPVSCLIYYARAKQIIVAYMDRSIAFYSSQSTARGLAYVLSHGFFVADSPSCMAVVTFEPPLSTIPSEFASGRFVPAISIRQGKHANGKPWSLPHHQTSRDLLLFASLSLFRIRISLDALVRLQ